MENKEKIINNYLFNGKLTVSKTGLKMLRHVELIYTLYCITDMTCTVACQEIKVMRFLGSFHLCLVSFSVMPTRPQKQFIKKLLSDWGLITKRMVAKGQKPKAAVKRCYKEKLF